VDDLKQKRFLWGLLLVWLPLLPTLVGLANAFGHIFTGRATGIAVVAGGFTEMFVSIGFLATLVFAFGSIIFLARSFEPGHWLRTSMAVVSMGFSILIILFTGLFCWMIARRPW